MSPIDAHTMAYATLLGYKDVQSAVETILDPYYLISALHWCHCYSRDSGGLAKCPQKTDQLTVKI